MNMESFATSSITPEDAFQLGSGSVLSKKTTLSDIGNKYQYME